MVTKRYEVSFEDDENVLRLIVMIVFHSVYTKNP